MFFFLGLAFLFLFSLFLSYFRSSYFCFMLSLELSVDVSLILSCPADHVPDPQTRILLGMAEARSVNVKNTHREGRRRGREL